MTAVGAITALSERFLRERTFDLVVAPAIADAQFDAGASGLRRLRNEAALLSAFAWGVYEDVTTDSGALTFAALTLIPACYYTLLVMVCAPLDSRLLSSAGGRLTVGAVILVLSLGPVIACYWPERHTRGTRMDTP